MSDQAGDYCVPRAERARLAAPEVSDTRLDQLAAELLSMVRQPALARGQEITRERWETMILGKLAEIFRLGMDAQAEKDQAP